MTDWIGTFLPEVLRETSPELAIKIAYDYGRDLRQNGAQEATFAELLSERVEQPFEGSPLLPYIRAGFSAGFHGLFLPWRREIEPEGPAEA